MGNKLQQIFQAGSRHKAIIILTFGFFSYHSKSAAKLFAFFRNLFLYLFILTKVKNMIAGTTSTAESNQGLFKN